MGEMRDFVSMALMILAMAAGGMAIRWHKWARRIFGIGLGLLIIETGAILLSGLNGKYFQLNSVEAGLNVYFNWLNLYEVFIMGIIFVIAGLAMGLFARSRGAGKTREGRG